jgi:dephospho-CoA kinase
MRLRGGAERLLDTEMDLARSDAEPTPASLGQLRRLGDLFQPQQPTEEGPRLRLRSAWTGDLHVIEIENGHAPIIAQKPACVSIDGMIAITGGAASGKSTLLAGLAEAGYAVVSADEVVRSMWRDPATAERLLGLVGVTEIGRVRDRILTDAEARRRLNAALHAPVLRAILDSGADFAEVPLLFESCSAHRFRESWAVTCGEAEQRRRLLERLGEPGLVERLLRVQIPDRARVALADRVLRTDVTPQSALSDALALALRA